MVAIFGWSNIKQLPKLAHILLHIGDLIQFENIIRYPGSDSDSGSGWPGDGQWVARSTDVCAICGYCRVPANGSGSSCVFSRGLSGKPKKSAGPDSPKCAKSVRDFAGTLPAHFLHTLCYSNLESKVCKKCALRVLKVCKKCADTQSVQKVCKKCAKHVKTMCKKCAGKIAHTFCTLWETCPRALFAHFGLKACSAQKCAKRV